jgi:diguanylate cyclase (GGDEF)-like protein/PAS domain S-box-containing protein
MSPTNALQDTALYKLAAAVLEECNLGIIVLDENANVIIWNHWMSQHSRIPAELALRQKLETLFPELEDSRLLKTLEAAVSRGLAAVLSQSLHKAPFPLYPPQLKTIQNLAKSERMQQNITITPLCLPNLPRYGLVQITDVSQGVRRETLLRSKADEMHVLAHEYHENELYLKAILDNALDGIITISEHGIIETFNCAAEQIFQQAATQIIGKNIDKLIIDPQSPHALFELTHYLEVYHGFIGSMHEVWGRRNDAKLINLELSISEMWINERRKFIAILRDITDRKRIQDELRREKEQAQITLQSIGDAVITVDALGKIQYLNPVAEQLTGWRTEDAARQDISKVLRLQLQYNKALLSHNIYQRCLAEGQTLALPHGVLLLSRQQQQFFIEGTFAPLKINNELTGIVIAFHDVTQALKMAHEVNYRATHDALTGLINRLEFENRLDKAIQKLQYNATKCTVFYIDLDQFKIVNDTCRHIAGDRLLQQLSALLQTKIPENQTLARLGGDEFGVLLETYDLNAALKVAEALRKTISEFRFVWENKIFPLGASIGVVEIDQHFDKYAALSAADTACFAAKEAGRNCILVYHPDDAESILRRQQMTMTTRITNALEKNLFFLVYQEIKSLTVQPYHHIELLLRMGDEDGSVTPPMSFIPAAERYNLMPRIDQWVVENALRHYALLFQKQHNLLMHINLSSASLGNEYFLDFVLTQLARYAVNPSRICFELTETTATVHYGKALRFIEKLKALGCRFAIDDFGSGLSSFKNIKGLPIDYIKIDGLFVRGLLDDKIDYAMVETINHIGKLMGVETIAESVESSEVLEKLREIGVDHVQGIGICTQIPLNEFIYSL